MSLETPLLDLLARGAGTAPVFIQSFEVGNLEALRVRCDYPLVQLMSAADGPWDLHGGQTRSSDDWRYAAMVKPTGLGRIARYATAIGVQKNMVMTEAPDGALQTTSLVQDAHAAGVAVHVWTFRAENHFLPQSLRRGAVDSDHGDLHAEIRAFAAAGIDGLFCDHPLEARNALADLE